MIGRFNEGFSVLILININPDIINLALIQNSQRSLAIAAPADTINCDLIRQIQSLADDPINCNQMD